MLRKVVVLVATLFLLVAPRVYSLGLGNIILESALNQPLNARVEILQLGDVTADQITVIMASPADFERFNIERVNFLSDVRFAIESTGNSVFVRLTSTQPVREPYLSFILDTRWPTGRILSEHTVLLDLPVFGDDRSSTPISQPISPVLQAPAVETPEVIAPVQTPAPPVTAPVVPVIEPVITDPVLETEPVQEPGPVSEQVQVIEPEPEIVEQLTQPAPAAEVVAEPDPLPEPVPDPAPAAELVAEETPELVTEEEPEPVAQVEPEPEVVAEEPAPDTLLTTDADTLWDIAQRVRPNNSVSLQQTMLAIQQLNPDAFIGGNINLLRSGQVIRIPDLSEIQSVDQQQAVSEIVRQNQQLEDADAQPLAAPATDAPADPAQSSGQLSVVTAEDTAEPGVGSTFEQENAELDARIAALENQLAVREEEVDRARIEREELISRLDELDAQIASAMEIITLQDLQLAQLQESLAEAAAQAAMVAAPEPAEPRGGLLQILTGNTLLLVVGAGLLVLALVFALLRRNKRADVKFDEDLDNLVGQDNRDVDAIPSHRKAAAMATGAGAASKGGFEKTELDDELSQFLNLPDEYDEFADDDGADDDDHDVEPDSDEIIAHADQLIDDNELDEAAKLLQDAVSEDRNNVDLQLKLLEVYAEQNNDEAFAVLAIELGALESEEIALTVAALRNRLTPPVEEEVKALDAVAVDSADDMDFDLDSLDVEDDKPAEKQADKSAVQQLQDDDEGFDFNLSDLAKEEPAAKPASTVSALEDEDSDFSLTFDLGGEDEPAAQSDSSAETEVLDTGDALEFSSEPAVEFAPESAPDKAQDLEGFDFNVDPVPAKSATTDSQSSPEDEIEGFDFSVDMADDKTVVEKSEPATSTTLSTEEVEEFEFDLDQIEGDGPDKTASSNAASEITEVTDDDMSDFDEVDFDVDDVEILDDEPELQARDRKSTTADAMDDLDFLGAGQEAPRKKSRISDDLDFLSIDDEAATNLELAYAFQKMGDPEGAREILEEVIKDGNPEQVKEARILLESLDK